jgi:ATP-binding cassette, subfamily B (MDR/TAP), member 1
MDTGVVTEQGTHQELIAKPDGLYARLVAAQKLREKEEATEVEASTMVVTTSEASALVEQKVLLDTVSAHSEPQTSHAAFPNQDRKNPKTQYDYSLFTVLRRLALLNSENWRLYALGTVAAIINGSIYPCFGIVFGTSPLVYLTY